MEKKLTEREEMLVKLLKNHGYKIEKGCLGWEIAEMPKEQIEAYYKDTLYAKIEYWSGKFTMGTVGSHWSVYDAERFAKQVNHCMEVLGDLRTFAPEFVE